MTGNFSTAYFSMEIGLDNRLPTFSGGLGVLAGDTIKSAADLEFDLCAVTLLHRKGYFRQTIENGAQQEGDVTWSPEELLQKESAKVKVTVEGREVVVSAWRYDVKGATGHVVPVYFLDTDDEANSPEDRKLTDHLYGGNNDYRLMQEIVLGIGGVRMLDALGHRVQQGDVHGLRTFHMNEGHASFLTLALLDHFTGSGLTIDRALDEVRKRTVFTTHTPVEAGHDRFETAAVEKYLSKEHVEHLQGLEVINNNELNMSLLAIRCSRFINGVAKRHGEISREMFPGAEVVAITNGVHTRTWTHSAIQKLWDKHIPGWNRDNDMLRYACEIPLDELKSAHLQAKTELMEEVESRTGIKLATDVFTIGFARRAAEYKRADLIFDQLDNLRDLAKTYPIQILFSGKAHPRDTGGKKLIENVIRHAESLAGDVTIVYVPGYDMDLGLNLTSGVDLWLNNPIKPMEASGTSGMKAALNGVPSLSTLDGWWVEGCVDGVTGWEIHDESDGFRGKDSADLRSAAADSLIDRLGKDVLPLYYKENDRYLGVMRNSMFLNGSYFNTQRMVAQYGRLAYRNDLPG